MKRRSDAFQKMRARHLFPVSLYTRQSWVDISEGKKKSHYWKHKDKRKGENTEEKDKRMDKGRWSRKTKRRKKEKKNGEKNKDKRKRKEKKKRKIHIVPQITRWEKWLTRVGWKKEKKSLRDDLEEKRNEAETSSWSKVQQIQQIIVPEGSERVRADLTFWKYAAKSVRAQCVGLRGK